MVRIAYDAGHGLHTSGKRSPEGEREWVFNDQVAIAFANSLSNYQNVALLRLDDPTGKRDVPLKERTDKANDWNADVVISFHHNALSGKWHNGGGVETFRHPNASGVSREIQAIVHPLVVQAMGLSDRGMKREDFHMVRESEAPAVLIEGGFMDSTKDIEVMRDPAKLKAQGEAVAKGLVQYFKLQKKASGEVDPMAEIFSPSTATLKEDTANLLKVAYDRKVLSSPTWYQKANAGELKLHDLVALQSTIVYRTYFKTE